MSAQLKDESHSEQQAKAQLESIVEMVAALTIEGAASAYVKELSPERVRELLVDEECDENVSLDDLREQLADLIVEKTIEPDDFEFDEDDARQTIMDDPLSLQVRGDWHTPGDEPDGAVEFELLLCTGGPAVRIIGDLDSHNQPERPRIQHQDWGTPWTEYFHDSHDALQTYCEQFYYGD